MGLFFTPREYYSLSQSSSSQISEPPSTPTAPSDCIGTDDQLSRSAHCSRSSGSNIQEKDFISTILHLSLLNKLVWKAVLAVMALFFLAAAYVQHNDPDPYLWMPVYLVPLLVNSILVISFPPTKVIVSYKENKSFQTKNRKEMRRHSARRWNPCNNWEWINKITTFHMGYCYILGFWTLAHYVHRQAWSGTAEDHLFVSTIESFVSEPEMQLEEAKELLGLCLVIAWLSFVSNGNFLRFGRKGILFGFALAATPIVAWVLVEKMADDGDNNHSECLKK